MSDFTTNRASFQNTYYIYISKLKFYQGGYSNKIQYEMYNYMNFYERLWILQSGPDMSHSLLIGVWCFVHIFKN